MVPKREHRYRSDLFALVAYLFLAIVLTYPLILHFATHVVGDGSDDPALAWNLWWVPYALVNLGTNPIYTEHMFYPIGLNLAYYTLTLLNAFLSIPLQYAFNLVVAANVNLWLSFVLSGFGGYVLVEYLFQGFKVSELHGEFQGHRVSEFQSSEGETVKPETVKLAAFLAGAVYAFSSNKLLYASLGQFNIASSQWIPFYVLFLLKLTRSRDTRTALFFGAMAGLFLLFQALAEFIFASFLLIFTALYLVYFVLAHSRERGRLVSTALGLVSAAVVFVVPMAPILGAMIRDMLVEGDFIQSGLGFADVFSSDVFGFFVPSRLHPLWGGLDAQFNFAYINFAFLGYVALALALIAIWKVPGARIWAIFGAVFILITLGPDLRVNGNAIEAPWLPFNWLLEIPFIKGNRYPSRWSVMVVLALAILVGYGSLWLLMRVGSWHPAKKRVMRIPSVAPSPPAPSSLQEEGEIGGVPPSPLSQGGGIGIICILLLPALLFEQLAIPLPLSDFRVPDVYKTIAQDEGDFRVLEVPLAWRNGFRMTGTMDAAMMFEQWYQTVHHRPILGGNTSRNPELKFQYFTEAPVINSLIAVETGHAPDTAALERDRQLAAQVLQFFGVRYVVWHTPRDPGNRAALEAARQYIEQVMPVTQLYDQTDETGRTVAYRVKETGGVLPEAVRADAPLARLNFTEGWGAVGEKVVWATRRQAKFFWFQGNAPAEQMRIAMRFYAPMAGQSVNVRVNGESVGAPSLQQGWGEYVLSTPGRAWRVGLNTVELEFAKEAPVAGLQEGDYTIGKTGVTSPASLVVRSAGNEVGDFGHVFANGTDVSPNGVGYNVVVVNPQTGAVEAKETFNTFVSAEEADRMARFIQGIPAGKIVAVAVRDEASRYLAAGAVDALRTLGAKEDLRGKWRWSHAVIGVKGAAPGGALEVASETMPAQVVIGVGALEPNVAGALEWVGVMRQ